MASRATRGIVLLAALASCGLPSQDRTSPPAGSWGGELATLDAELAAAERFATSQPSDWIRLETVASLSLERARRTGELTDYRRAEEALDAAFAAAAPGSGPVLAQAELDLALHAFDSARSGARRVLAHPLLSAHGRAAAHRILATVAASTGDAQLAETEARRALALDESVSSWTTLAAVHQAAGQTTAWSNALDSAESLCDCPQNRFAAWVDWQRGLERMGAGDWDAALDHYQAAEADVSGDWVVEEHIAEALVALDRPDEAVTLYREILVDHDAPVVWWGLGRAERALGQSAEGSMARARCGFERQLATYPDGFAGHAIDFFVEEGPHERALALARRDARVRPGPHTRTRLEALENSP